MRIFIGSSTEQSEGINKVSEWLRECGHHPLLWNEAIHPGRGTLIDQLIRISHEVDGAIFIFAEDDTRVVRGAERLQPRDNVVFEYGLFMGTLGAESVVFLRVGKANIATDLHGVVYISLSDSSEEERSRKQIVEWAGHLAPGFVKALGFDLSRHLTRMIVRGLPVGNILGEIAPRLVTANTGNEINALCSDKGEYSERYYRNQFDWVAIGPTHCIKRVFVRVRGDDYGFSPGETIGIRMHLDQASARVEIRWIYADEQRWLGGPYSSSLGFAIFGESWIMHWGLESGAFHDRTQDEDYGVLELLKKRFHDLWDHASKFDERLSRRIRERQEVGE